MHCPGLLMRTIILLMRRHSNQLWDSESPSILIHIWPPTSTQHHIQPPSTHHHPPSQNDITQVCVCVYGGRIGKSKYKLSLSNKYWCFRISRVAMPDFVTFFGCLRLVPDDLTFIVVVFFNLWKPSPVLFPHDHYLIWVMFTPSSKPHHFTFQAPNTEDSD